MQLHTDKTLVTLWQQGEETAFDALYKRYAVSLLGLVIQKTGHEENSKEIVQECFLAIYLAKNNMHEVENFKAYLYAIAKNKIFSYYRHELVKQKYQRSVLSGDAEIMTDDLAQITECKELQQLILDKIEELPPKCKEVFKLSRQQHLSHKAIAERLNISENTVDQHIQKALRVLRTALEDYNGYHKIALASVYFMIAWA